MLQLLENFLSQTLLLFIEISPYLILGFFFAGLLHTVLGESYVRKHFSKSGMWSTIKAAIFGIPLPVCSCAVIPLAESLRKEGASKSSTMAFLVSTPSSGIDSIMATYALMGPVYALFRPIASFFSGILVGIVTHFKGDKEAGNLAELPAEPEAAGKKTAIRRDLKATIKEIFTYGFNVIPAEIAKSLLIGVIIGGAIAALVPEDFGAGILMGSPILNYVVILLISIPLYVCATGSIPIAAALITKGVLPGAAMALLIAGPATNSVTISFVYKKMGKRVTGYYIFSIIAVAVTAGLLFDAFFIGHIADIRYNAAGHQGHLPQIIRIACPLIMAYIFINTKYNLNPMRLFRRNTMAGKNIHTITVPDMTCGHCKMKISRSLEQMPELQSLSIDLAGKEVTIESEAQRDLFLDRIKKEGYSPK